jgi:simple sugar transport system ATP-binding protein
MASAQPILESRGITKHFGGVVALNAIDLEIRAGELLALIGDNGAGKSTLVKILCGALQPDSGEILHRGEAVVFDGPLDARTRGIETVHQDLALVPALDVAANLYLGRERKYSLRLGPLSILNQREMARGAAERLRDLAISLPRVSGFRVDRLSGGQRQAIAIARAAAWATDVLFMDEPTAALGIEQSKAVLALARRLVERGSAVVLITHTLPYVMEVADRVVVLRQGRKVGDLPRAEATPEGLVSRIVGFDAA